MLSIYVDVEIFTLPDGIEVEHGEAVLVDGMVGRSTGAASQMRVWIKEVGRRGTFSAVGKSAMSVVVYQLVLSHLGLVEKPVPEVQVSGLRVHDGGGLFIS